MLALIALMVFAPIFASGAKEEAATTAPAQVEEKEMTHDELVAAAKAEGQVVVYATSSRIAKAAAAFTEKYGIEC